MLASFYRARIKFHASDLESGIYNILEATDLSKKLNDTLWMARCNGLAADIYAASYAMTQAVVHRKKAIEYYDVVGKNINVKYSLCDLASELYYLRKIPESSAIIDSLICLTRQASIVDSTMLAHFLSVSFNIETGIGNLEKAQEIIEERIKYSRKLPLYIEDKLNILKLYIKLDSLNKSTEYLRVLDIESMSDIQYMQLLSLSAELASKKGDISEASRLFDTLYVLNNRKLTDVLKHSTLKVRGDYNDERIQDAETEIVDNRNFYARLIFIFIIISILIIISLSYYNYIKQIKMKSKMNELSILTDKMDDIISGLKKENIRLVNEQMYLDLKRELISDEKIKLTESVNSIFIDHIHTINTLCAQYFENDQNIASKDAIFKQAQVELNKIRNPENLKKISNYVNTTNHNIINDIRNKFPDLSDDDLYFIAMNIAGFNTRIISVITGLKSQGVYSKRRRLQNKLKTELPEIKLI